MGNFLSWARRPVDATPRVAESQQMVRAVVDLNVYNLIALANRFRIGTPFKLLKASIGGHGTDIVSMCG
jgi:hypothetical protein